MTEFLSFDKHPEFVAAFRFLFWTMYLGLGMVAWRYALWSKTEKWAPTIIPTGVAIAFSSFGMHQFYYWMVWRANAHESEPLILALAEIRHITSVLLIIMCAAGLMYASHLFRVLFGKLWLPCAAAIIAILWTVGYIDARWI